MTAKRISATLPAAKRRSRNTGKSGGNVPGTPKNANDHEQRTRVHPALPSYSVVVPATVLSSINVAVVGYLGIEGMFRKGRGAKSQFGTSRITGPRGAGATGAGAGAGAWTAAGLGGLPNCPSGPNATAAPNTIAATIAPKMPPILREFIREHPPRLVAN